MLLARDVMTARVVTTQRTSTVGELVDLLLRHGISAVPVMDGETLVGVVSEGDLLHRAEIGTDMRHRPWWRLPFTRSATLATEYRKSHSVHVADIMTAPAITVEEDAPLEAVADILHQRGIKRVPVMRGGRVAGIISRSNLVRAIAASRAKPDAAAVPADDASIRLRVATALRAEPWQSFGTEVKVANGVVKLCGLFGSQAEREASRVLVENLPGVRGFQDDRMPIDTFYEGF